MGGRGRGRLRRDGPRGGPDGAGAGELRRGAPPPAPLPRGGRARGRPPAAAPHRGAALAQPRAPARGAGVAGEPGRARQPHAERSRTSFSVLFPMLRCRASSSSARSVALRPPAPVPRTTAISSAAESPPGPRRASRSRGRSAAGRSRTDRVARRCRWRGRKRPSAMASLVCGRQAGEASPGPDNGSPPISPAIRIREHDEAYAAPLTAGSTATSPHLAPARVVRGPRARLAEPRRGDQRDDLDRVEGRVQADRRVDGPAGEEHPAEGDPDGQQDDERVERALGAGLERGVEQGDDVRDGEEDRAADDRRARALGPRPGGRREPAEEQLLADGRDDRRRDQVEDEARSRSSPGAAGSVPA